MKSRHYAWALLITAVIAAPIATGLYIADLLAENARLDSELHQLRSSTQDLLASKSHFVITPEWVFEPHVFRVKESGAQPCLDCHRETDCSYCHVRKAESLMDSRTP